MKKIGITEDTFQYIVESVYNEIVKNNKIPVPDIDKIKLDYAELSEHVLSKIPKPEDGKDYVLTDKDKKIISDEIKKSLPDHTKIKSEIVKEIESKKFDTSDIDTIVSRVQSKIKQPEQKLDSTEIIKGLLDSITTSEDQKRLDFYKDQVFSPEIKSALSKQVLDQIEIPKDGDKGESGEKGEPGKDAPPVELTERDKKEIAEFVDVTKLIKDRNQDLVELVKQLKSGKIKIKSGAGIDAKEIIAEFNKIIGHENWQDRGLAISNDGDVIAIRPDENYTTDDNLDVTSTDNPTEDRVDTVISISDNPNFDSVLYNTDVSEPIDEVEGLVRWNDSDLTIDVVTGLGPVLQVGQEEFTKVWNDTGDTLLNGKVVSPDGGIFAGGIPGVALAKADQNSFASLEALVVLTQDIEDGEWGFGVLRGQVRGVDTSGYSTGVAWLSPDVAGDLVNTMPEFPDYTVRIGGILNVSAENGVLITSIRGTRQDTFSNFWNGVFRESFDFLVTSAGGVITGSLSPTNGHPDMTMLFSDGFTILTTTPAATVVLTAGTDTNPQINFVYIPATTKVLTISTSGWPTTEHIKVATILLKTAATTLTDGALKNQNYNDHVEDTNTFQGHLSHITEKLRKFEAQWDSGTQGTAAGFPSNVYISVTAGVVYQLHGQTFPALSMPTDDIEVVNNFASAYTTTDNLNTQTLDALGNTLANSSFSFVVWGVVNKTGEPSHLMCNLPVGTYSKNSPASAVADAFNYSVYTLPSDFQGVGFLIARFTMVLEADGTTWSLFDTEDLRGKLPNTTAGGGAGGTGVTTWTGLTDTPAVFVASQIPRVNAGGTALDFTTLLPSGATQVAAGVSAGQFWRTASHATLPDNVVLQGV